MGRLITESDSSSNHHSPTTPATTNDTDSRQSSSTRRNGHPTFANRSLPGYKDRDARSPVRGYASSPGFANNTRILPFLANLGDGAHHSNTHGFFGRPNTSNVNSQQRTPGFSFFLPKQIPLTDSIVNQIDYYFSEINLVNDEFLKSHMDEQGWVPIDLIASFNKVKSLTEDIDLILDSLRKSSTVEVQDKKLRSRYAWMNWVSSTRNDSASTSSMEELGFLSS